MGQFFEYEMTVDSRDVDGWGRCRPSAVLGYLQEAVLSGFHCLNCDLNL